MKKKIIISLTLIFTSLHANNIQNVGYATSYGMTNVQSQAVKEYTMHEKKDKLRHAFKWYHRSAIKGHITSQYELALMFHYGSGVRQNGELARLWFKRASKKGHAKAASILYRFYAEERPQYMYNRGARYSMNVMR
ncbi:MAG: Unknown protein [uncultured Sulfurovum sp.]|uniref:beta-lactamase n=1 Tax=uncultured Sulfurovum sp. TaxID=269237 RepID=A0A6S6TIH8_9BACT|nr:MAG: Unknown protein [uncultured Sulfurovum sp.]